MFFFGFYCKPINDFCRQTMELLFFLFFLKLYKFGWFSVRTISMVIKNIWIVLLLFLLLSFRLYSLLSSLWPLPSHHICTHQLWLLHQSPKPLFNHPQSLFNQVSIRGEWCFPICLFVRIDSHYLFVAICFFFHLLFVSCSCWFSCVKHPSRL